MSLRVKWRFGSRVPGILNVGAITLYPFVLLKQKSFEANKTVVQHEAIHIEQIRNVGVLRFYITYLYQYVKNRLKGHDHNYSYYGISYEKEAYARQNDYKICETCYLKECECV